MSCSLYRKCASVSPAIIKVSTISYRDRIVSNTSISLSSDIDAKLGFPIQSGNGPSVFPLISEKYNVTLRSLFLLKLIRMSY